MWQVSESASRARHEMYQLPLVWLHRAAPKNVGEVWRSQTATTSQPRQFHQNGENNIDDTREV
jgi:hypothetical protein